MAKNTTTLAVYNISSPDGDEIWQAWYHKKMKMRGYVGSITVEETTEELKNLGETHDFPKIGEIGFSADGIKYKVIEINPT